MESAVQFPVSRNIEHWTAALSIRNIVERRATGLIYKFLVSSQALFFIHAPELPQSEVKRKKIIMYSYSACFYNFYYSGFCHLGERWTMARCRGLKVSPTCFSASFNLRLIVLTWSRLRHGKGESMGEMGGNAASVLSRSLWTGRKRTLWIVQTS